MHNGGTKKLSSAIGFGIITLLILASITSMIMALLLKFTNINEGTLVIIIFIIALSIYALLSGFIAGEKAKKRAGF